MEYDKDTSSPDTEGLFRKLTGWIKRDMPHVEEWRKSAKESFEFYSGKQWSDDDMRALKQKNRPAIVHNRVGPLVNAIVGSEINNRREVRYIPREQGDAQANEVLTAAAEWFRDECEAEDEESESFQDAVISGMGWVDTTLTFDDNPDGDPLIERLNPLEMGWDCEASKANLVDATRVWRIREMSYEAARQLFPEYDKAMLHAGWAKEVGSSGPVDQDAHNDYQNEGSDEDFSEGKKCLIAEIRWFENAPFYRGSDLQGGVREYTEQEVKALKEQFGDFPVVRQTRRVVKRAFIGRDILGEPDQPLVPSGFTGWECITGYQDKVNNQFYGVVEAAKDPQRWANKFMSQVMDLLNSQSKGGIMAERGAFEDDAQAEQSWAKADAITYMQRGSLSGDKPKILPKPVAQFPTGFFTLFQTSNDMITQVTGLSPEFIGNREVDQAGVLEYQRRQSSLNLLASLFNALRRYRKRQGKIMLFLIQNHLSDGRLVRIVGNDLEQYVPLTKDYTASATYDIIVDDAPSSPNEKDRTWQIITQMLPVLKDFLTPDTALELLEASPLPASLVSKWKKKAEQAKAEAAQNPQPSPEEMQMQMEQAKFQMDMQGKQADIGYKQQAAQVDMQMKGLDLMIEQEKARNEMAIDQQKLQVEREKLMMEAARNRIRMQQANTNQVKAANQ